MHPGLSIFKYLIKLYIKMTSTKRGSALKESYRVMNMSDGSGESKNGTETELRNAKLSRDGTAHNPAQIENLNIIIYCAH